MLEVHVPVRVWRFKSSRPHQLRRTAYWVKLRGTHADFHDLASGPESRASRHLRVSGFIAGSFEPREDVFGDPSVLASTDVDLTSRPPRDYRPPSRFPSRSGARSINGSRTSTIRKPAFSTSIFASVGANSWNFTCSSRGRPIAMIIGQFNPLNPMFCGPSHNDSCK